MKTSKVVLEVHRSVIMYSLMETRGLYSMKQFLYRPMRIKWMVFTNMSLPVWVYCLVSYIHSIKCIYSLLCVCSNSSKTMLPQSKNIHVCPVSDCIILVIRTDSQINTVLIYLFIIIHQKYIFEYVHSICISVPHWYRKRGRKELQRRSKVIFMLQQREWFVQIWTDACP